MSTILFFEDDDAIAMKVKSGLIRKFGKSVKIELAKDIIPKQENDKTFVHRLYEVLKNEKSVELIVADVNLWNIDSYRGLSAEVVSEVGRRLFIPVCIYSLNVRSDLKKIKESNDASINIEGDPNSPENLTKIKNVYDGFVEIKRAYKRLSKSMQSESLPRILAVILKKTQYVDRFSLYSLGNQGFLKYAPTEQKKLNNELRTKTIPYILGNWLLLSIMKFPGILLSEVAAASYLNININDYEKPKVKNLFKTALFSGPFSKLENYWWRYELDEILDRNKVNSGLDLARYKINNRIKSCKCSVDSKLTAGYYCIITEQPVSLEKSTSEISWIPKGADLARVSKPAYDRLKPWIGIL